METKQITSRSILISLPFHASQAEEKDLKSVQVVAALRDKPPYVAPVDLAPKPEVDEESKPLPYVGEEKTIRADFEDTLLSIARANNVGYVEIVAANPKVDPWLPGDGTKVIIPGRHIIPHNAPRNGIVINLAEMRMYSFVKDANNPATYPLGIGREGLNTPLGETKITRKKDGPTWRPTPRMRKEDPELPEVVPPGPDNPLGTHALYLDWPAYLIHGTHKPFGVGRRVSSGCIRMYPEDIIQVFEDVPVGTKVTVIKEPVKLAWIDDILYLEAHAEDELADEFEDVRMISQYKVPDTLFKDLANMAGDKADQLDWEQIRRAIKRRNGVPVAILKHDKNDIEVSEDILSIDPDVQQAEEEKNLSQPVFNLNS